MPYPWGKGVTTQVSHTGHTGGHHAVRIYTRIQPDFNLICIPQQASHQEVITECLEKMQTAQTPRKQGMRTRYLCERLPLTLLKLTLVCMRSMSRPRSTHTCEARRSPLYRSTALDGQHRAQPSHAPRALHHTRSITAADLGAARA